LHQFFVKFPFLTKISTNYAFREQSIVAKGKKSANQEALFQNDYHKKL